MTVTVEQNKGYTDLSGHFYQGQTLDDVKEFKGLTSIFSDEKKEFARIDTDGDGVLSKTEITNELKNDVKLKKFEKISGIVVAVCALGSGILSKGGFWSTKWGLIGGLNIAAALLSNEKQEEAEAKLLEGTKEAE